MKYIKTLIENIKYLLNNDIRDKIGGFVKVTRIDDIINDNVDIRFDDVNDKIEDLTLDLNNLEYDMQNEIIELKHYDKNDNDNNSTWNEIKKKSLMHEVINTLIKGLKNANV